MNETFKDFQGKLNSIVEEREVQRSDLRREIDACRANATQLEAEADEIAKGRADYGYSRRIGITGRESIEGEKATIGEEIRSLRSHADRIEQNLDEIVRARVAAFWMNRYRKG